MKQTKDQQISSLKSSIETEKFCLRSLVDTILEGDFFDWSNVEEGMAFVESLHAIEEWTIYIYRGKSIKNKYYFIFEIMQEPIKEAYTDIDSEEIEEDLSVWPAESVLTNLFRYPEKDVEIDK